MSQTFAKAMATTWCLTNSSESHEPDVAFENKNGLARSITDLIRTGDLLPRFSCVHNVLGAWLMSWVHVIKRLTGICTTCSTCTA